MYRRWLQRTLAISGLLFLLWATWVNGKQGLSSLLSKHTQRDVSGIALLDRAIRLSPSDARAYDIRARSFLKMGNFAEAVRDFETAMTLKPHDYLL